MFDLDWSKLMLIAVIAVVFIGPKELPSALRTLGKWVAKARTMAGEFQRNVDDMMREADLQDIKKSVDEIRGIASSPTTLVEKAIDPKGELRNAFAPPEFGSLEPPADKLAAITPPVTAPQPAPAPPPASPAVASAPPASDQPAAPVPVAPAAPPPAATGPAATPAVAPPPAGAGTRASA